MKKLKYTAAVILTVFSAVLLCSCGKSINKEKNFTVVTSFYPMYVFTKNITDGAENVSVINMTEPQTGCLHDYQLLPEDLKTLEKADVFVINGGGMEAFMEKIYENMNELKIIIASDGIELMSLECDEPHDHEQEKEFNSHVWTYVPNAVKEIENITEGLCGIDPSNEQVYKDNAGKYIAELNKIHEEFKAFAEEEKNDINMVVTHEAFDYMAKGYGFKIAGRIMSEHNSQPSAGEISALAEKINNENVIGIFKEPQYPEGAINTLAKETNITVFELDPMVTGSDEFMGVYESKMRNNLKTIEKAVKQKKGE